MRVLVVAAAVALAGCAAVRGGDAAVTMRLAPMIATNGVARVGAISVAPVMARGLAGDRRYTYVTAAAPGVLHQAATFFWEEAPPRVLERALAAALGAHYAQVYTSAVALPAGRRVTATLTRFEETQAGAEASAVVAFEAVTTEDSKIVGTGTWCARAPVAGPSGTARAQAFAAAVASAVEAFAAGRATPGC